MRTPLTVLTSIVLFCGAALLCAQKPDSAQVTTLLSTAKTQAGHAAEDAQRLDLFSRSGLSWTSRTTEVNRMRTNVNLLGKTVQELNSVRSEGSEWQQLAIDRIHPLLQEMADTLTKTIRHMNENPGRIHDAVYRDYTAANYELASRTSSVVGDFVEYGKVKLRAEQLEQKLEIPKSATSR